MNGAAPASTSRASWWSAVAAVAAVAATYGYFLLFAEFALLALAEERGFGGERVLLGLLGAGGIGGAIAAWRWYRPARARAGLRVAFGGCAAAALLALTSAGLAAQGVAFAATGLFLGALTVVLASTLRAAVGERRLGLCIGVGTGVAYGACNLPWVFSAEARWQTLGAALLVLAATVPLGALRTEAAGNSSVVTDDTLLWRAAWVVAFAMLVWLDSAAFFVIQHTHELRAALWQGQATLLGNATAHVVFAIAAGLMLDRGWRRAPTLGAIGLLALAVWRLNGGAPTWLAAQWLYVAGVSLYSVMLVEMPARSGSTGLAAAVFAVAGWGGSALGIGMATDLHRVPPAFALLALGIVVLALTLRQRPRSAAALGVVALAACGAGGNARAATSDDLIARGREVYIREGCIHCHSQYVRPHVADDVLRWGPAVPLAEAKQGSPPLLGNRRQGPDLANVGTRRSPEWNRIHLQKPRAVTPGSRMPSYAHLFRGLDSDGDALVHYLASLGVERLLPRLEMVRAWRPQASSPIASAEARATFLRNCANCHGPEGRGDGALAWELSVRPPDWRQPGWRQVRADANVELELARIIKFGLPGSPMAGHEYLSDDTVVGLARLVQSWHNGRPRRSAE